MEIKIECGCGTKYKFDVEPVNGHMPAAVACPECGTSGTVDANRQIAEKLGSAAYAPAPAMAYAAPAPSTAYAGGGAAVAAPSTTRIRVPSGRPSAMATLLHRETPSGETSTESGRPLLHRTTFFVKERIARLRLTDTYDILDPANGQNIGIAREEPPIWAKWLRLVVKKHRMPTAVNVYEGEGQPAVLSVTRGFTFIRAKINVSAGGRSLGYFKRKLLSLGGGFLVYDHADQQVAEVKGNWKGRDFRFTNTNGHEIGIVSKKWAGLAKELLTSADNYVVALTDLGGADQDAAALLLAASLSIDLVFNEAE
ncbi:MAG TPA: phospholipid scramblase-related protein [Candidatus Angelobacter sp.]|nr:phospholipid scramblase-related protein [Candidatus Angelobacter sp.]